MQSLIFGLVAALAWGLHDFLVRGVSQKAGIAPLVFTSLLAGCVVFVPLTLGSWDQMTLAAATLALASGVTYAVGSTGLYNAFAIGPVRLVAPICGAYPLGNLALAVWQGKSISSLEWLAVFAVVAGIALVARSTEDVTDKSRGQAMIWAVVGAMGFALTVALGQAAARMGGDLPTILIGRIGAVLAMGAVMLMTGRAVGPALPHLKILCLIGTLDVTALGIVLAAGNLENPEYAAVASSIFGIVTILLAWRFLSETMRPVQWFGVLVVFGGIGILATGN